MPVAKMKGTELVARALALEGVLLVLIDKHIDRMPRDDANAFLDDVEKKAKAVAGNISHQEMNDAADEFVSQFILEARKAAGL